MAGNNIALKTITRLALAMAGILIGSCTHKPAFGIEFNPERHKLGLHTVSGDAYYNIPEKSAASGRYKYVWNYTDEDKVHVGKTTFYFPDRIVAETDTYTDGKTWRVTYEGHDPDQAEDMTLLKATYFFEESEGWDGRTHRPGWHCWLVDGDNQQGVRISKPQADSAIAAWRVFHGGKPSAARK